MSYKIGYRGSPEERFNAKLKRGDGCWEWLGSKNLRGYGSFRHSHDLKIKRSMAHHFAYELANGPVPSGMFVLHHCDNPSCVRPDHLFLGDQYDNMQDAAAKGHCGKHRRKLRDEDAYAILWRAVSGESNRKLAREYGVASSTVQSIVHRKTWSSLSVSHD